MLLSNRLYLLFFFACLFALIGIFSSYLLPTALIHPQPEKSPTGYIVSVPSILRIGESNLIHYAVPHLHQPGKFVISITKNREVIKVESPLISEVTSVGNLDLQLPQHLSKGVHELQITFLSSEKEILFYRQAPVTLQKRETLLVMETDRPYYKPGQEVFIRVISLNDELRVLNTSVTVTVSDPKGFKVGKWELETDEYGLAEIKFPLSSEPNLGNWEILVVSGEASALKTFVVDKYILPKFEVGLEMMKGYYTPNEREISGVITATYSYGKPLKGRAIISVYQSGVIDPWRRRPNIMDKKQAHRNQLKEDQSLLATLEEEIDGSTVFELRLADVRMEGELQLEVKVLEAETEDTQVILQKVPIVYEPVTYSFSDDIFKPGLPFATTLKAFLPDGKPYDRIFSLNAEFTLSDGQNSRQLLTVSTKNGHARVLFQVPEGATSLCIGIHGQHCIHHFRQAFSPTGVYVSVIQDQSVGGLLSFSVYPSKNLVISPSSPLHYQVVSRGQIITSGVLTKSNLLQFQASPLMSPRARLLVHTVSGGELIVSHIDFAVSSILPNTIQATFSEQSSSPTSNVSISVKTSPFSRYGLLAIDKSVTILGGKSQFQADPILKETERFSLIKDFQFFDRQMQVGAKTILSHSGTLVFTNYGIAEDPQTKIDFSMFEDLMLRDVAPNAMLFRDEASMEGAFDFSASRGEKSQAESLPVRSFFPETWMALSGVTDHSGEAYLQAKLPDSITSWSLFSFSLSKERGLGIGAPQELQVLKPFFLSLDLPYSAIFGELIPVKVALYNYHSEPLLIQLTMDPSPAFEVVEAPSSSEVKLDPEGVRLALFYIKPKRMEPLKITVRAISPLFSDAVQKTLLIDPPGVRETVMKNVIIDHPRSAKSEARISLTTPLEFVNGSEKAIFSLTGDLMGPTLKGLESLLQMPSGCGEQNMLHFAPDVFVARYLKSTSQLRSEIMSKAVRLMMTGYQRELTFAHKDGSFSAFGERDGAGSMWLTAFVVKTFAQARGFIFIDEQVIENAVNWILSHQTQSGQFLQVGRVIHTADLMGGEKGAIASSAFVLIALVEAGANPITIQRGAHFLENHLADAESDPYSLAIVSYALSLAKSPKAPEALKSLKDKAILSEDKLSAHWGKTQSEIQTCTYCPGAVTSLDVETTSYALLALLAQKDLELSQKASRWLLQQRTSSGGFLSTQDTCLGLQALTAFAEETYVAGGELTVGLSHSLDANFHHKLHIHGRNAEVIQSIEVPVHGELIVTIEGQGKALLQTEARYNVIQSSEQSSKPFEIVVKMTQVEDDVIQTESCVETIMEEDPGMTLLEIGLLTGFEAIPDEVNSLLTSHPQVKRVEFRDKKVILYLNELLHRVKYCFPFSVHRKLPVRNLQPTLSTVFAYYSPHLRSSHLTTFGF